MKGSQSLKVSSLEAKPSTNCAFSFVTFDLVFCIHLLMFCAYVVEESPCLAYLWCQMIISSG